MLLHSRLRKTNQEKAKNLFKLSSKLNLKIKYFLKSFSRLLIFRWRWTHQSSCKRSTQKTSLVWASTFPLSRETARPCHYCRRCLIADFLPPHLAPPARSTQAALLKSLRRDSSLYVPIWRLRWKTFVLAWCSLATRACSAPTWVAPASQTPAECLITSHVNCDKLVD